MDGVIPAMANGVVSMDHGHHGFCIVDGHARHARNRKERVLCLMITREMFFVGNLPFDVKDEELYQLFCGKSNLESNVEAVKVVRVVRDPHLNVGKGIAYVLF
ncbi:hypothetical protein RIF29_10213 [Crotalaria pallida]|uniref:RRM domain-containing protein n=1 Tax=Crotalaria pallida TaxID=3830 RepID=A0AAN9IIA2_CROPI